MSRGATGDSIFSVIWSRFPKPLVFLLYFKMEGGISSVELLSC